MMTDETRATKATDYFGGDMLKALGDGKVGGYLVVFGGPRDADGEYFAPDCDFHLDWFGGSNRPILYHHGLKDDDRVEEIGTLYKLIRDDHGIWAEGQLDMTNPRAQQVYSDVRKGKIGWSSGSAPHLAKVDEDGRIWEWAIVEASLTPTPSAGKRTTVQALKFDTSTFTPDGDPQLSREPEPAEETRVGAAAKGERDTTTLNRKRKQPMMLKIDTSLIAALEKAGVSPDQIIEALKELGDGNEEMTETATMADAAAAPDGGDMPAEPEKGANFTETGDAATIEDKSAPAPAKAAEAVAKSAGNDAKTTAALLQMVLATMKTAPGQTKAAGFQGDNPARQPAKVTGVKTAYHDLSAPDMAFIFQLRAQGKHARIMPVEFQREMADKAMKAYHKGDLNMTPDVARKVALKADFNNTLVAGEGQNWVPDLWSSILWQRVRIDNNVAKNIEVFQMPSPTFEYPIESTDPTVYAAGESDTDAEQTLATNVFTRSKLTVSKLQFSAKKLGLQVGFSTEIEEDSIIPFIPQLRAQTTRAFANAIDNVILNSDSTTGTGNINYKNANTSAAPTAKFLFGGGNGMRYNALIANTGVLKNFAGGAPTLLALRALRFSLISATNAYGIDPAEIMYICDPYTYGKLLSIDEINVYMNNGRDATVNTGMVRQLDGSPIFPSAELALTDNTGYVPYDLTGTLGNIVVAAKNAWKVGYVRQVMTDVSYVPWNDSYILTMTARLAIGKKDTVAAGVGYNINVN